MSAEIVRAACPHDCPDTCGMLVTVEDGVATKIQGDPSKPFTDGTLCTKVAYYLERTYSPDRLLYPMRRVGPKGKGQFERITWDAALDEIAARLKALAAENPETILPCSYAGTMGMVQYSSMDRRFFHKLGASLLDRTLCSSAGKFGLKATLGGSVGMDPERFDESKLILLWGANPIVSNLHLWSRVQEAKRRGAKVIAIDPYRSLSAEKCSQHVALLPGTDGALALGMMHVLITEGLIDRDYIERATLGFAALAESVRAYDPARVSAITGLSAEEIVNLARRYGATKASFLRLGIGLSRHDNGGATCRAIACLPALTGAYAHPAGGALLSSSRTFGLDLGALERRDLMPAPTPRTINMTRLGRALTEADMRPPVKALYVYNSNPASIAPNQELVLRGLAREDLFVVVHEQHLTDTTDYADIVLPATTSMEHVDLYKSFGHLYVQLAEPVIDPAGEARSNWHTVRLLARALGLTDPHFEKDEPALVREVLASGDPSVAGITYERLKEERSVRLSVGRP